MTEALFAWFSSTLPVELAEVSPQLLPSFESNETAFNQPLCRLLLGHEQNDSLKGIEINDFPLWTGYLRHRLQTLFRSEDSSNQDSGTSPVYNLHILFLAGVSALNAFVQSNVTGPPLSFDSAKLLLPHTISTDVTILRKLRKDLIDSLAIDGVSAYNLIPNVELFAFAKEVLSFEPIVEHVKASRWARLRVNFLHQRLLSEVTTSLQSLVFKDIEWLGINFDSSQSHIATPDIHVSFLLEKAMIQLHYGLEKEAREAVAEAAKRRRFAFALTGILGKRTKFQQNDVSQLVVLAKSAEDLNTTSNPTTSSDAPIPKLAPKSIDIEDETLLESISFSASRSSTTGVLAEDDIPDSLKLLDPEKQPLLNSLDSIILLSVATSITNTSPADGLTREETLPYAIRALQGGSSNWQVYTQALLVRSRIEGYKSRTVERGLLQLQALVDQIIAETTKSKSEDESTPEVSTFLPKPKPEESASAAERLLYVFQLSSPTRWELEAELAARWVNLGGLKSALEIYERLEMWPEVALCWAGIDRDDKARDVIRRQLYHISDEHDKVNSLTAEWSGQERHPIPANAPRLYCILGDLDKDPSMYEKSWEISNQRYFRSQKSLGRYWYERRDYTKASLAFSKAIKLRQLDHGTWFALGCALLELNEYSRAAEVFSRAVQLDNEDAESWSNLAVALLSLNRDESGHNSKSNDNSTLTKGEEDEELNLGEKLETTDPQKFLKDAMNALKQAAKLKRDNYRIWDNLLTVAASLNLPRYLDIITAQKRIIDLRGSIDGEKCVDENILDKLVDFVTTSSETRDNETDSEQHGIVRMTGQLVDQSVIPLITSSARLWYTVARLALWRNKPSSALDAHEKAWRAVTQQPGWEYGAEKDWNKVVDATVTLVEAYKDIGPRQRTEGMSANSGEPVRKDWLFKSRSAARTILGRGKESWEGTDGWEKLNSVLVDMKK
jgi:tetratricopeptide (TPR) repeat protein